jgi:MYXO-CTERM domain-containing protein
MGDKLYACNPAGSQIPKGKDGWCNTDADCKCKGAGAKCVFPYCTFTKASDAPAGIGGTGAGGTSAGGSTSTAGTATTPTAGTATTPTAGTASTPATSDDGGGCSVSAPGNTAGGIAVALGMVGLGLAFARRRR